MKHERARSELLALLNSRKAWDLPPYSIPTPNPMAYREAVGAYARANDSDPFAYGRAWLHVGMGYILASDMLHDAQSTITRRAHEPRAAFAALDSVKKQVDADRAWNQHRSAMRKKEKGA